MELHHLRTFVVVAEEKNVTRAAKRLFMTPPAVSAHIKALEEELNVTLFVRTPQGMQITDKGALLKIKAEQTLQAAQNLVNHATQMQDYLIGRLIIGLNASPRFLRVANLINQINADCPGIDLTFTTSVTGKILDNLQNNSVDAGFIFGASPCKAVITFPLTTVDLVVAAPRSWHERIHAMQWEGLAELSWICSTYYCPFQQIIDEIFRQKHLTYRQIAQVDDELTKCELVSAGIGLALLERSEAEQAAQEGSLVIWESDPIPCELAFAVLKERQTDPLIAALVANVVKIWAKEE